MDYWSAGVTWRRWPDWAGFRGSVLRESRIWFIEQGRPDCHMDVTFDPEDYLTLGSGNGGIRNGLHGGQSGHVWIRLPMDES